MFTLWRILCVAASSIPPVCISPHRYKLFVTLLPLQLFGKTYHGYGKKGSLPRCFYFVINKTALVFLKWKGERWEDGKSADKPRTQIRSTTKRNIQWDNAVWLQHFFTSKVGWFLEAMLDDSKKDLFTWAQSPCLITKKKRRGRKKKMPHFGEAPLADVTLKEMLWRGWGQRGIQASQCSVVCQQHYNDMTIFL